MKKIGVSLLVLLTVFSICSLTSAALSDFSGRWINNDSNTRGVTAIDIQVSGNNVTVEAWGKASPSDIDWGRVNAIAYAPNVSSNLAATAHILSAQFDTNFCKRIMIIRQVGNNRIGAEIYTTFTDNSGRSNYSESYVYVRGGGPSNPGNSGNTGNTDNQGSLAAPSLISPANGTVFNNYPRRTLLKWATVQGAASYTVEVDYKTANGWMTDLGKSYIIFPNLKPTAYSFDFVGAQPGRWRVWAVGPNGETGPKSGWWEFSYTK